MQRAIGQATLDVRRSIASLQENPQPRQSLQDVLAQLVEERGDGKGTAVYLTTHLNQPLFLPPAELEQVKRLVGEAIHNARRHAQANRITVSTDLENDNIQITIADDGQGFDPKNQAAMPGDHFGLSIMKARAARIGGNLVIHSQPGKGTKVTLTWKSNQRWELPEHQEVVS
jgi:signal transduction histidine kinase